MKIATPELIAAFGENLTHICRLWTVTRKGGAVMRFTDLDRDIWFEGERYFTDNSFQATGIEMAVNSAANDMDITVLLDISAIEYTDLQRGMYDNAPVTLHAVSYNNLDAGSVSLFDGTISDVALPSQQVAVLRLRGDTSKVSKNFVERYSATCRAKFGDERCKVNLALYTKPFTVTDSPHGQEFTAMDMAAEPNDRYTMGTVQWLTGDNVGTFAEVSTNTGGRFMLFKRTPYPILVGDTGTVTRGCQKTVDACKAYNNLPNYRGEPYVPTDAGLKA